MGFVSSKKNIELTSYVRKVTSWYGQTQRDGMGYAYPVYGDILYSKTPFAAPLYWGTHPTIRRIWTKSLIWHTRIASNGAVIYRNTHPFVAENVALSHNGVLKNFEKTKKELSKDYTFQSDTDSEVILASYLKYGLNFLEHLKDAGITGTLTVMILTPENILLYTNTSSMVLYSDGDTIYGTSDTSYFGKENAIRILDNTLYSIKNASITNLKEVKIPRYAAVVNDISTIDVNHSTWISRYLEEYRVRD
jgi:glucosamine 6-phosphate synthetase-like amidotransferase/phosphosugar isomerase protein